MLTSTQQSLYDDLILLLPNEAFYTIDQQKDGVDYRIFNYRLASYTDFCAQNALEARGIMFRMENDKPVELVSRTPTKHFNYKENPFTMEIDFSKTSLIMDKADGSLISTYLHNDEVNVKTKASLSSSQAVAAQKLINNDEELKYALKYIVKQNYTVNMEYVAPTNRIVVGYAEPKLIILNIRHNDTGEYININTLRTTFRAEMANILWHRWVKTFPVSKLVEQYNSIQSFVDQIPSMTTGVEGFVFYTDGLWSKHKTDWYKTLHHTKDSINSTRRLFEVVLAEGIDDIRSMFADDPIAIARIDEIQEKTDKVYNHLCSSIENFYKEHKGLDRKEYAILGQKTFTDGTFGLAMSKYLGKEPDYKEYLIKNFRKYGFTDHVDEE